MTGLPKTATLFRYRMQRVWGKELLVLQIGRPTYSCPELSIQGAVFWEDATIEDLTENRGLNEEA